MTPLIITLRGAIGIKAGLGRDEIVIDIENVIPEDALTVAIKGDNGAGKSTLMNLGMTPWLNPPQLPGNIYDEFGESGERILEWSHGGERYRSTIQYRQTAKTKSAKAFLHRLAGNDWQPVCLPDHTVSDGKSRTYEACLTHILGAQSVYYLSAFRAQNAPRLADYDDPKGLMRDLLHLDAPQRLSEQANSVRLGLENVYKGIKAKAANVESMREQLAQEQSELSRLETLTADLRGNKQQATEDHARAKAEYDHAVTEDLDQERVRADRRKLNAKIGEKTAQRDKSAQQADNDIHAAGQRRGRILAEAERQREQIRADIRATEQRISVKQTLLHRADEIRAAEAERATLTQRADALAAEREAISQRVEQKRQAAIDMSNIGHTLDTVKREGMTLRRHIDDLKRRAAYVDQVPCGGAAPYDTCPALQDAITAAKEAFGADAERKQKLNEYYDIDSAVNAKRAALDAMGDPDAELNTHAEKQRDLQSRINALQRTASMMPQLESAEADIQQDTAALAERKERLSQSESTTKANLEECAQDIASIEARRNDILSAADAELRTLQSELLAMPAADESNAVDHARRRLHDAEQALQQAERALSDNTAAISSRSAESSGLRRRIDAAASVADQAARISDELAKWDTLSKGLRGVVDLSIEDAGPGIAEIANRLLTEAYGPRFSLQIISQRELQNGRRIECFDISVIDAESGIETSIVHKSGGESVWLDKAMTDAVGLYNQDSAGMHYETLFADEAEDGLTQERKAQFYRMDRAALNIGGYQRKFFVSHNPDAWAMAEAVIDMNDYRSTH
jgi:exonuclease SbcC